MPKLWVREKAKWKARKPCRVRGCLACAEFYSVYLALAGTRAGNTYFAMNHRWREMHRRHGKKRA